MSEHPMVYESLADQWARTHGELLTVSGAARALGVARGTIYKYLRDGDVARTPDGMIVTRSLAAYIRVVSTKNPKRGAVLRRTKRGSHLLKQEDKP